MSSASRAVLRSPPPESRKFAGQLSLLFAACLILWGTASARGQGGSAGSTSSGNRGTGVQPVEGRVLTEGQHLPLHGVRVTLTGFKGAERSTAVTDHSGTFSFSNLPVGQYTLTFSHPSYQDQSQQVELSQGGQRDVLVFMSRRRGPEDAPPESSIAAWALQIPEPAQRRYSQGLEALQKDHPQQSIAHFQAAIQVYARFAAAYAALGSAQLSLGDRKAAAESFERALQIDENLPGACLGLATLYAAEKRYREAEKQLLRARMLKPDDWRVHHQLGEVYWRTGDWARAEDSLRRAAGLHAGLARLHLLLMNVLALQEKNSDALAEMEKFLQMFPQDSFAPQVRQKRDLLKAQIQKTGVPEPVKQP